MLSPSGPPGSASGRSGRDRRECGVRAVRIVRFQPDGVARASEPRHLAPRIATGERLRIGDRVRLIEFATELAKRLRVADRTAGGRTLVFGAYAEGAYECVIPYATLKPLAKSDFPLP